MYYAHTRHMWLYTGVGPLCVPNCPQDFTDNGIFCLKPAAYGTVLATLLRALQRPSVLKRTVKLTTELATAFRRTLPTYLSTYWCCTNSTIRTH
jgi:hypothetical protein